MYEAPLESTKYLFELLDIDMGLAKMYASTLGQLITYLTSLLAATAYVADFIQHPNPLPIGKIELGVPHYDFVIIGAGSAGCVMANRLSANGKFNVLLLEAGGNPLVTNDIPLLAPHNLNQPQTDWMFDSTPQKNSGFGSPNNRIRLSRGKSLGGSSNLNWMIYMRGNPKDFDNWARILNDSQWKYDNLLPFFKMAEDYHGNYPSDYHGKDGPMTVNKQRFEPLVQAWIQSGRDLGINTTDPNARQTSTLFRLDVNTNDGRRMGNYKAYLKPAMDRSNLNVIRYAEVLKINFKDNKAESVTYRRHGEIVTVPVGKEVILSAGAIMTPVLLQRSGIGDKQHLERINIKVVADLPGVGENLQDHVNTLVGPYILNDTVSLLLDRDLVVTTAVQFALERKGPYTWNSVSGMGFVSTTNHPEWPNVCAFHAPLGIHEAFAKNIEDIAGLRPGLMAPWVQEYIGKDATFALVNVGRPKSRGSVKIADADHNQPPLIDMNYYGDKEDHDIDIMVEGQRFFSNLFETPKTWKKYNATLLPKQFPGCEKYKLRSNEYYKCVARQFTGTTWHLCGTAKLGTDSDPMAVLDSHFKVRKIQNLRVVDASVFPVIPNGNLNAPTIMIAEKAASIILKDYASEIVSGGGVDGGVNLGNLETGSIILDSIL